MTAAFGWLGHLLHLPPVLAAILATIVVTSGAVSAVMWILIARPPKADAGLDELLDAGEVGPADPFACIAGLGRWTTDRRITAWGDNTVALDDGRFLARDQPGTPWRLHWGRWNTGSWSTLADALDYVLDAPQTTPREG